MALDLVANAATGGVLGVVGAGIATVGKIWQNKQAARQRRSDHAHELDLLRLQAETDARQAEIAAKRAEADQAAEADQHEREIDSTRLQASYETLREGMALETAPTMPRPIMWLRSAFRVVLTSGLCYMTYVIWTTAPELLPDADVDEIRRYVVEATVTSASMAVAWWFFERAVTPSGQKHQ